MTVLKPKNWERFQHYKDRSPPWVKLHKSLLDDRVFMRLPIASKALAPLLWLLASESKDGAFDASFDELEFRLRVSHADLEKGIKPLIDNGFFVVASGVLAECLHVAVPEAEAEAEADKKAPRKRDAAPVCPSGVDQQTWADWLKLRKAKKAPVTETVIRSAVAEAEKAGVTVERFLQIWCARGSQGLEASWLKDSEKQEIGKAAAMPDWMRGAI